MRMGREVNMYNTGSCIVSVQNQLQYKLRCMKSGNETNTIIQHVHVHVRVTMYMYTILHASYLLQLHVVHNRKTFLVHTACELHVHVFFFFAFLHKALNIKHCFHSTVILWHGHLVKAQSVSTRTTLHSPLPPSSSPLSPLHIPLPTPRHSH